MTRLTNDDSLPRVDEVADRHIRLCAQTNGAKKYEDLIKPFLTDFQAKWGTYRTARRANSAAYDIVRLKNNILDDVLRDVQGRVKEYDRNNPGSKLLPLLFPEGVTPVITLPDKDEPAAAEAIAQKISSLGQQHELFPLVSKIEDAVGECHESFAKLLSAQQAEGNASTELVIAKLKLVRQYNTNYFLAATDVDKMFADKLFPVLKSTKKPDDTESNEVIAA